MTVSLARWETWLAGVLVWAGMIAVAVWVWRRVAWAVAWVRGWWQDHHDDDDPDPWPDEYGELEEQPPPLPPEQSAQALGFRHPPRESPEVRHWRRLEAERRQAWTDVEERIWAAYDALGLEGTAFTRAMALQVKGMAS